MNSRFVSLFIAWLMPMAAVAATVQQVNFSGPDGVTLQGVLYQPDFYSQGNGYSAVVLMHGCSGIWSNNIPGATNGNGTPNLQNHLEKWGLKLAEQGIVALVVDSFTPRKPIEADPVEWQDHCSDSPYADTVDSYTTRVLDSRAGWDYLNADNKIDENHIALMGWSHGAQAAMVEAGETGKDADVARPTNDHRFMTTVVFYPGCGSNLGFGGVVNSYWRPHRDVLMQMGDADSFHGNCQSRFSRAVTLYGSSGNSGHDAIFTSHVDAAHSFDGTSQTWPADYCNNLPPTGDVCAMNRADIDSLDFLLSFLQRAFVKNDFDYDSKADVLFLNTTTGGTQYWKGAVKAQAIYPGTYDQVNYSFAGTGDFNNDQKADLFFTKPASNYGTMVWSGAVKASATYPGTCAAGYSVAALCDTNGDNSDDVVWFNGSTGGTMIWPAANKAAATYPGAQNTAYTVATCGDFDGDGSEDLFWRNATTGANEIWPGANKAARTYPGANADLGYSIIGAGDTNNDGLSDVVWYKASSGATQIWPGAIKASATYPGTLASPFVPKAIGDYDGDGSADLLSQNTSTLGTQIWPGFNKAAATYPGSGASGFSIQK